MTLSLLGYPDQAQQRVDESLVLAEGLSHPYSLTAALTMACLFHSDRREWHRARKRAEEVISLSTEQGFPDWLAYGKALRGRILVLCQGEVEG